MMYKISELKTNNFRVFKDEQSISLLNKLGAPYDFVCIYGSNGSGKTSIVDAIEWLVTGELHRVSHEMGSQEKNFKGKILTNYEASTESLAKVEVELKDNVNTKNFSRITTFAKRSNNDYQKGRLSGNRYIEECQILPNSKIADFISATKPSDRLTEWSRFANNQNDFPLLDKIYRLKIKIHESLNQKQNDLNEINKQLQDSCIDDDLLKKLNDSIIIYNNNLKSIPMELPKITVATINKNTYTFPNFDEISSITNKMNRFSKDSQEKIMVYKQLVEEYETYTKAKDSIKILRNKITDFTLKVNQMKKCKNYEKQLKELNSKNKNLQELLGSQFTSLLNSSYNSLKKVKTLISNFENKKSVLNNEIMQYEIDQYSYLKDNSALENTKKQIENQNTLVKKYYDIITNVDIALKGNEKIQWNEIMNLPEIYYKQVESICNDIIKIRNTIFELKENQKFIQTQKDLLKKSLSQLNIAIQKIKSEIIQYNLKQCPVCQTPFNTNENLIVKISEEYHSSEYSNIEKKMNDNLANQEREDRSYQAVLKIWEDLNNRIISDLGNQKAIIKKKDAEYEKHLTEQEQIKKNLSDTRTNLLKELNSIFDYNDELTKNCYHLWEISVTEKLMHNLKSLQQFCEFLETIQKYKEEVDLLKYIQFLQTRLENYPEVPLISSSKLKDFQNTVTSLERVCKNEEKLTSELESVPKYEYIQLSKQENILQNSQIKLNGFINTYETYRVRLIKATGNIEISEEGLKQKLAQKISWNEVVEKNILPSLDVILGFRESVESYCNSYHKLECKRNSISESYHSYEKAFKNVDYLCTKMKDYQEKVIENIFSGNLVNRLYRLLEPNKDFPKLNFEIEFNNGKPELYLKAVQSKESAGETILPELIFSTAQLNTISLCIFLSNNLARTNLKTKTLILDDPISSFDDINTVAFADLLRILCTQKHWQIIFTTHDENLFRLLKVKISPEYHNSCFMNFHGKGNLVCE